MSHKDRKAVCAALRPVYQAANEEAATKALAAFEASELGQRHPAALRTLTDAWERFTPFLAFADAAPGHLHHQQYRVAELPAAQGVEEPGPAPLRRRRHQAAVAGHPQH
ncbi:transposase [Actinomyces respiraculi]|uniref:Transposase n=1 Tax=Actinomyces respiraculi TaxID=2744574 RepID=A0A7T0LLZ8_9ACTO|nr:transposase [Actinomyces respiraculi]